MTTNYHTPIPNGAAANADTFNAPLGQMDEALTEALLDERDGHIIQDDGTDVAQQPRLNFTGAGVTVIPEVGKTTIEIPGGGGNEWTIVTASVTTSNVTGVEGTLHILDVSGMTADRDYNLPTPTAAGKRCGVSLSTGDDTYELLLKINGTEWSRVFITNEIVTFVSTGTDAGDWRVEMDGRIPAKCRIKDTGSQVISTSIPTILTLNEADYDNAGGQGDTTNHKIIIRRPGKYLVEAQIRYSLSVATQRYILWVADSALNIIFLDERIAAPDSTYPSVLLSQVVDLTTTSSITLMTYQESGANQSTYVATGYIPFLSITEILP